MTKDIEDFEEAVDKNLIEGHLDEVSNLIEGFVDLAVDAWKMFSSNRMRSIRDSVLLPTLNRLVVVGGRAVKSSKHQVFDKVLWGLGKIYELSNDGNLGPEGWENHLGLSIPSETTMASVYSLGAYSVYEERFEALSSFFEVWVKDSEGMLNRLITHPNFSPWSEQDVNDFFDSARDRLMLNPFFFRWFNEEADLVTNSICQFDFLVGLWLYRLHLLDANRQEFLHYPNFARFYGSRLQSLMNNLKSEPGPFRGLLEEDVRNLVESYFYYVEDLRGKNIYLTSWSRPQWEP